MMLPGFRLLVPVVLVVAAQGLFAQAPESRGIKPHEAAWARGDVRGTLRLALEEARALPDELADPSAAADAEILLLRIQSLVTQDPAAVAEALTPKLNAGWR